MKAMAENDPSALALLHDRHAATLFALCLRILRDAEEADEVLEDVFFQLWQRADQYDARRGSVLAYLVTLARSRALERARRRSRRGRLRRAVGDGVVQEALVDLIEGRRDSPARTRSSTNGAGKSDPPSRRSPRGSVSRSSSRSWMGSRTRRSRGSSGSRSGP